MRFKLDENLDRRAAKILQERGHDVKTVPEQALGGAEDPRIADVCRLERRCLITLDLDFSLVTLNLVDQLS
jgi:predicted nuclease of predicted toxin-antitoxin system